MVYFWDYTKCTKKEVLICENCLLDRRKILRRSSVASVPPNRERRKKQAKRKMGLKNVVVRMWWQNGLCATLTARQLTTFWFICQGEIKKKYAKSCEDFLLKFKRICFGKILGIKKYGGKDNKMFHKLFIKLKIYVW